MAHARVGAMVLAGCGLAYGTLLFIAAALVAGFGHGSSGLFVLFGAPLSLLSLGGEGSLLFAFPFYWAVVGWACGSGRQRLGRAMVSIHYATAVITVVAARAAGVAGDAFGGVIASGPAFFLGIAVYFAGQVWFWRQSRIRE